MIIDLVILHKNFCFFHFLFPRESTRKKYFLAACKNIWDRNRFGDEKLFWSKKSQITSLDKDIDWEQVNIQTPFGGIIGRGDSKLDQFLSWSKVMRLHAVVHDAAGYMKREFSCGPGYCYVFTKFPINSCALGHLTGILVCAFIAIKYFHFFRKLKL